MNDQLNDKKVVKMLTVKDIKKELAKNELALKQAIDNNNVSLVLRLKIQRDELKNILIDLYEEQLKAS